MIRYIKEGHIRYLRPIWCTQNVSIRTFSKERDIYDNSVDMKSPVKSSIFIIEKMIKSKSFEDQYFYDLANQMSLQLFVQNITIALINTDNYSKSKIENFNQFLNLCVKKLMSLSKHKFDYYNSKNLVYVEYEGLEKQDNLLYLIFQLALNLDFTSVAYTILINIINKTLYLEKIEKDSYNDRLIELFFTSKNISNFIDLSTINQSQNRSIKDVNNIVTLVLRYNQLATKFNYEIYKYNDFQLKSIIDKASYVLTNEFNGVNKDKFISPYSTLELLIREFGLIISKRVSNSISYYKTEIEDDEIGNKRENEGEDNLENELDIHELLDKQILSKYLQFCYLLIRNRCEKNDPVIVYNIWTIIKPFHNKLYNATIDSETNNLSNNFYYYQTLSKIISLFSKNKRYRKLINEILFDLPLDSVKICPELMTSILYHCGRTNNESLGSIVGSRYDDDSNSLQSLFGEGGDLNILNTGEKFTPGQVHAFLSYNLRLGNKKRALEIVEYLKHKLIGFTAIDFNELIRSILYSNKMKLKNDNNDNDNGIENENNDGSNDNNENDNNDIAWSMILNNYKLNQRELNKFALVTYLDFMINNIKKTKLDMVKVNKIFELLYSEYPLNEVKLWNHFFMSYFKYLIRKFPLQISKTVYNNNTYSESNLNLKFTKVGDYKFFKNPFRERYNNVRIPINYDLKTLILRDIYQRSNGYFKRAKQLNSSDLKEAEKQYFEISKWVYDELMTMNCEFRNSKSIVHNSIIIDLTKTINKKSREFGFKLPNNEKEMKTTITDSERNYRIRNGENIAIGDMTVNEEYEKTLNATKGNWRKAFNPNRND